jgi:uncharacterized protein (DUF305 family)
MNNPKAITALIAVVILVAVGGAGVYIYGLNNDRESIDSQTTNQTPEKSDNTDELTAIEAQYAAMEGETFDRNFISNMIAHHDGAVAMAKMALENAKHDELKQMADEIISAQNQEKAQMLQWQKDWGYPSSSAENMQDHSAMGTMDGMAGMTGELEGKTGDDFDKAFLGLMIEHHESAVAMAKPGPTNAQHEELKDLTQAIIDAQSKEIGQMKQWQKDWGYSS